MRKTLLIAGLLLFAAPFAVQANEKSVAMGEIEAARAAIEAFAKKSDGNKLVTTDMEKARAELKRGEDALTGGMTMFGLGDITLETGQEVKIASEMVELYLVMGQSRLDSEKNAAELEALKAQVAKMKAKVKVFDDRKAEVDRLRANQANYEATVKDLTAAKAENTRLTEKSAKLEKERQALQATVEQLKEDLAKNAKGAAAPATPPATRPNP